MKTLKQTLILGLPLALMACAPQVDPDRFKTPSYDPSYLPMVEPYTGGVPANQKGTTSEKKQVRKTTPHEVGPYNIDVLIQKFRHNLTASGAQVISKDHKAQIIFPTSIAFGSNRNTLKHDFKVALEPLIETLKDYRSSMILITGHTDNTMSVLKSQEVSLEQANALLEYLKDQGIESRRMLAEGKGQEEPMGNNQMPAGRAQNNRIEMLVIGLQ